MGIFHKEIFQLQLLFLQCPVIPLRIFLVNETYVPINYFIHTIFPKILYHYEMFHDNIRYSKVDIE